MRASRFFRLAGVVPPVARPYKRVRQAIDQGGRGLLVAAEVFKEFEASYRSATAATTASAAPSPAKPLTVFCGSPHEVEPLTILLLKVLCDLRRLEEMRFLFTQCVLELEGVTPSIELFNVYLLAVSMTDTYNEHEVENVVELMRVKGATPDIVTKLSMFMLYVRLGKDEHVAKWWPLLKAEVEEIIEAGELGQYPLLALRLQHCFQALARLHYDAVAIHQCFQLLRAASPARCTPSLLIPYMVLSVADQAAPPAAAVEVLETLEAAQQPAQGRETGAGLARTTHPTDAQGEAATEAAPPPPALSSEVTALRLLAKCARWGDGGSAAYVRAYLRRYAAAGVVVAPENEPVAALLHVTALARAKDVVAALALVETDVPPPLRLPGERPKLFLASRHMTLLDADPMTEVVEALARDGGAGVEAVLGELRSQPPGAITAASLDLVMAAFAQLRDAARAERLLAAYGPVFNASPTAATYAALLGSYGAASARVRRLLHGELADAGVRLTPALLRAAMDAAFAARDTETALTVAELHAGAGVTVSVSHGMRLLRELALLVDEHGIRRALRALRASKSPVDSTSLAECVSALQRWGVNADDVASM